MGREFIGECSASGEDPGLDNYEMELAIKFIKRECGKPPLEVDVQICREDHELASYPVIAVVWDDYETEYPEVYIQKCIEAFERFEIPEEVHQRWRECANLLRDLHALTDELFDPDSAHRQWRSS